MPVGDLPATISPSGSKEKPVLPDERFANAGQIRDLSKQMLSADKSRAWMRNRVEALVNGWPMYPKKVTAAKGMGWFPRCNFRGSEGLISAQQIPLFDLLTETDHCIEIQLDTDASSEQERQDWENTIQEEFTWLMFRKWRTSYNYHLPLSIREMLVHGMGASVWPNNRWTPRTPRSGQILFPEGVSLDFENDGEYFLLREFCPSVNVYQFIRKEETARKLGWFPDNVWKTLAQAQRQNQTVNTDDVAEFQRKIRRGDIGYWGSSQVGLWLNWAFVKEYEGGISLYCIEENISCGAKDKGYLFKKRFMWSEDEGWPLTLWPYDIGNGDLHSVVGLGWRTKDFFELMNRLDNAMAVQVLISALPQVRQTQPTVDPDKMKLMRLGGMSIVPYGLDSAMQQFPPLQNGGLALHRHFNDTMNENNQSLVGATPEPKDRETKYSFMLRSHDSARVSNGHQSLFECSVRDYYYKTYCRLVKTPKGDLPYQRMAQEWKNRCKKRGVPDAALTEAAIGDFHEVTSTGFGSMAIRLQATQLLLNSPVYANAPEQKKITIERDLVAASAGSSKVDRYARSINDAKPANIDESFATVENNSLAQGGDALIGDGQNDLMHARIHLQKGQEIMQAVEQEQMEPQQALGALQKILEHAGQHLANAKGAENSQEYKDLANQWRKLAKYLNHLQAQVEAQQGQPSPQQQLSEDGMIKMHKVEQDSQIKAHKAEGDMALKFRKMAFQERLNDVKTGAQIRRQSRG